jgi:glycosyltransferase involved in cell wall biosynthesis/O-antigen/teichoic acid export membrane protein
VRLVIANPWGERLAGSENILWTLLRHLDRARVEPIVVFLTGGPFVDEVAGLGIRTEVLRARRLRQGGRFFGVARPLRSLLARERPDAILGWGPKPQIYLGPASASVGLANRNVWMLLERPLHPVHRLAARLPAAAIACLSDFIETDVNDLVPRRRTFVVRPGIELPEAPPEAEVAALRKRLQLPEDRPVLGMVARLAPVKGQHHALAALAELRDRGVDAHLVFVGGDAHGLQPRYEPQLRRFAAARGLERSITFVGHAADPRPYLRLFEVFVSAAPDEGFGIALLEAMALGVPVVAVDAGGPREIVEHGRSGLLVASPEPTELADAVERIVADDELRGRLAVGSKQRVEEHFTADRMAAELTERLEHVAEPADAAARAARPPAPEPRETTELGRVVRNALSAYGMRAVMAISVLVLTPFLFRELGAGGFGTWSVVFVIANIFTLIETGFSRGLSQVVARQLGEGKRERVAETVGTSIGLLALLGLLAAGVSVAVGVFLPGLAAGSARHAFTVGMIVVGIERLVYFPLASYAAALVGYQRYDLYNLGNVVNTVAFTVAAIAVVELGGGVLAVIVAFAAAHLLMGLFNAFALSRSDRRLPLRPRLGDAATRRGLTSFSSYVLLAESMTFVGQRMDTLVIAGVRNAAAAGPYAAVLKLQTGLQSLTLPVVYQLMPMVSDLWARGHGAEVARRLALSTRIVLQVTLPPAAALAFFASDTVDLWLGKSTPEVAESILVLLMIVQIVTLTASPAEQVLVGIGRVRAVGLLTLVEGVSNLSVSVALVYVYGAIGAAVGTLATSVLISPLKVPIACRSLGVSLFGFLRQTVLVAVVSSLPAVVGMGLVRVLVSPGAARLAFGLALGAALTLVIAAWQIGFDRVRSTLRSLGAARATEGLATAGSSEL